MTDIPGNDAFDNIEGLSVSDGVGVIGLCSEPNDCWFSDNVVDLLVVGKFVFAS